MHDCQADHSDHCNSLSPGDESHAIVMKLEEGCISKVALPHLLRGSPIKVRITSAAMTNFKKKKKIHRHNFLVKFQFYREVEQIVQSPAYIPCPSPAHQHVIFPIVNISHSYGTFVTTMIRYY